jgi:hypothetical protein
MDPGSALAGRKVPAVAVAVAMEGVFQRDGMKKSGVSGGVQVSNRHVHNVFIGLQYFVAHLQSGFKGQ